MLEYKQSHRLRVAAKVMLIYHSLTPDLLTSRPHKSELLVFTTEGLAVIYIYKLDSWGTPATCNSGVDVNVSDLLKC